MTPQSSFMVLAPIVPSREQELRGLLASMNDGPGRVNPDNAVIPLAKFENLHFARLLILDDKTTEDVRVYGLPPKTYPIYLAFLGDIDGDEESFLTELVKVAASGLRMLFSCCTGFESGTDLLTWMKEHRKPSIANYVNWRGRTVRSVREEAALQQAIESYIQTNPSLENVSPKEVHAKVRRFVLAEKNSGHLTLTPESPTPVGWWIGNLLHLVGVPLLVLILSPLLIVIAPFYIIRLRMLEKTDPEVCPTVDQAYAEELSRGEDHYVANQFSAMGSFKPGLLRLLTGIGVLSTVNYAARHIVRQGRLGRVRSIHFARWVFLDGTDRMIFCSNYDGSVESYMDDFINKAGFGLNAAFSNGIGYPRTNWLVLDGCADERKYVEYLRRHTLPTQVWYQAYPGLTAIDLERNWRIRQGLEMSSLSDQEAKEWVALL
ncbi:MAG TPA: hypothetical protein VK673_15095 [Chthoniobacterales bacterium]|nr:hypothetical protein [Chthoniobacterales bacterium]